MLSYFYLYSYSKYDFKISKRIVNFVKLCQSKITNYSKNHIDSYKLKNWMKKTNQKFHADDSYINPG